MRRVHRVLAAAIATLALGAAGPLAAMPAAELDVLLSPVGGSDGRATGIDVRQEISGLAPGRPLVLSAHGEYEGVKNIADRITDLQVADANGPVTFVARDEAPRRGEHNFKRRWRSVRTIQYPVTIRYVALIQPDRSHGGPPMGLRPSGGGLAASGAGFLLLPETKTARSRVHWDLSQLAPLSVGVISAGEGTTVLRGSPDRLNDQWFFAGPAGRHDAAAGLPFHAYWLGSPPFDAPSEMAWAANAYRFLSSSFDYLGPPPPYRMFIKQLDAPPIGGGTALPGAFLMSIGKQYSPGQDLTEIHLTFIHEMIHQWVGHMVPDQNWFGEGLTVYYTATLGLRGGLLTPQEYEGEINSISKRYYNSPARTWSEQRISGLGFDDEAKRQVPYGRGAIYFATLNAALLEKSGGHSGLDAFLKPLFEARAAGKPITIKRWEAALGRALGNKAVQEFRSQILAPTEIIPLKPDVFGPCYSVSSVNIAEPRDTAIDGYAFAATGAASCP